MEGDGANLVVHFLDVSDPAVSGGVFQATAVTDGINFFEGTDASVRGGAPPL
ncbi:MAG: hypothetical protein GWN02_19225, partial [Gemmatimonadetes bacterium]|nr:hypothetical protein [Gemmatimonadota bacterium]